MRLIRFSRWFNFSGREDNSKTNEAIFLCQKGFNLGLEGKHKEAIECFNKAISLKSDLSIAWAGKGMSLEELGNYEESL